MAGRMRVMWVAALAACLSTAAAAAQGLELKSDADVLFGNADNCTRPAQIVYKKVRDKTPEWKTIRAEGVDAGSARYDILVERMEARIKRVVKALAKAEGCDCVVRKKDVVDTRGLDVIDITDDAVKKLESGNDEP